VQNLIELVETAERREIQKALRLAEGNKTRAADLLGISRFTLQRKLEKYGMPD
jgi:DNA-binding protein Fis